MGMSILQLTAEPPPTVLPHGTIAARPFRCGLGLATWKETVVLFGARFSTYLKG